MVCELLQIYTVLAEKDNLPRLAQRARVLFSGKPFDISVEKNYTNASVTFIFPVNTKSRITPEILIKLGKAIVGESYRGFIFKRVIGWNLQHDRGLRLTFNVVTALKRRGK